MLNYYAHGIGHGETQYLLMITNQSRQYSLMRTIERGQRNCEWMICISQSWKSSLFCHIVLLVLSSCALKSGSLGSSTEFSSYTIMGISVRETFFLSDIWCSIAIILKQLQSVIYCHKRYLKNERHSSEVSIKHAQTCMVKLSAPSSCHWQCYIQKKVFYLIIGFWIHLCVNLTTKLIGFINLIIFDLCVKC